MPTAQEIHEPMPRSAVPSVISEEATDGSGSVFITSAFFQSCSEQNFRARSYDLVTGQGLSVAALDGKLKSPTLSQLSRMVLMQLISTNRWGS